MPFESKAQQRYLYAQHPEVAKEFASDMTKKQFEKLPEKKRKKRVDKAVEKAKADNGY